MFSDRSLRYDARNGGLCRQVSFSKVRLQAVKLFGHVTRQWYADGFSLQCQPYSRTLVGVYLGFLVKS